MIDTKELALLVGGFYHIGFAIFHTRFWYVFQWDKDLSEITFVNRSIMRILNHCLIFLFFLMAYVSLFHPFELLFTGLGNTLLLSFAIFWLFRMFLQFKFFKFKNKKSNLFAILFLFGALIYIFPLFSN